MNPYARQTIQVRRIFWPHRTAAFFPCRRIACVLNEFYDAIIEFSRRIRNRRNVNAKLIFQKRFGIAEFG